jgi:putative FmdB family regulatory protein
VPTYQYACTECAERLEVVQRFSDDPLSVCPSCGGKLRKVFSPVGIVFKGSGFYRNDSRTGSVPAGAGAGKAEGGDGSASGAAKAESRATSDGATSDGAKADRAKSDGAGSGSASTANGSAKADKAARAGSSGTGSKVA